MHVPSLSVFSNWPTSSKSCDDHRPACVPRNICVLSHSFRERLSLFQCFTHLRVHVMKVHAWFCSLRLLGFQLMHEQARHWVTCTAQHLVPTAVTSRRFVHLLRPCGLSLPLTVSVYLSRSVNRTLFFLQGNVKGKALLYRFTHYSSF